jgi:osmotically-inducible protein OsmY
MKKMLLVATLAGVLVNAQEKTETLQPKVGSGVGGYTPQVRDPQQSRKEQSTQIVTNNSKGAPAVNYKGAGTVDEDLRQRALVALSTGSVGTQGVIASDQLTDIKVAVTNRIVTLDGDVVSEKNKEIIGKRIAGLDGVKSVENRLKVNPKAKRARADLFRPDGYSPGTKDQRTQDGRKLEEVNPPKK